MIKRGLVVVGTIVAMVACGSSGEPGDGGAESGVDATNDALTERTLGVAEGKVSKAEVAVFFREHAEDWDDA